MKSEERHRLQHNQLADWLGKTITDIKPYQNTILIAVLLVVVGMVAYSVWSRVSAAENTLAWDELNAALESGNMAKLAKVREDHPNTHVAHVAAVVEADYTLADGCNRLFSSKAVANQELAKAIELYLTVLDQSRNSSLLQRATFGLARAREAKGVDLERAMELYQEVSTKWPDGAFAIAAARRLDDLKRPATKSLYDRFAKFDPKPAYSGESGLPGQKPSFDLNSLPSDGPSPPLNTTFDLKLDGNDGKGKEKTKGKDKEETSKAPGEEKTPGAEKAPVEEKTPGAEKVPVEEKMPGAEKAPVEEKTPGAEKAPVEEKQPADEKKGSEQTDK